MGSGKHGDSAGDDANHMMTARPANQTPVRLEPAAENANTEGAADGGSPAGDGVAPELEEAGYGYGV